MTADRRRPHNRVNPDGPIANRPVSSLEVLAQRVRAVGRAWASEDAAAARSELQALAAEAALLSRMDPLPMGALARRQRVAS